MIQTLIKKLSSRKLPFLLSLGFILLVPGFFLLISYLRTPHTSPFMRGKSIAQNMGCVGCHETVSPGVIMNPGSLRGIIPNFHSGESTSLFWVENFDEFQEWVRQGVSNRIKSERLRFNYRDSTAIAMPTYGNNISRDQLSDLYTYFKDKNNFPDPVADAAVNGKRTAQQHGCFACHGLNGVDGISNPGSFKSYIPPWEGDDFNEMAKNDDEIKEWVRTGSLHRYDFNPIARYFLTHQKIKMPAYGTTLNEEEINNLVAYIHWLPLRTKQNQNSIPAITEKNNTQGAMLFNQSGCPTCHRPTGMEGFVDRHNIEIPPRSHLANRLRVLASMVNERETSSRWKTSELCRYYKGFFQEYNHIFKTIAEGVDKKSGAAEISTPMPAWRSRANSTNTTDASADINEVINSLILDDPSISADRIDAWKLSGSSCVTKSSTSSINNNETRWKEILARIEILDKEKDIFDNAPTVHFVSNETSLFDVIGFYPDRDLDLWLLRQYPKGIKSAELKNRLNAQAFPLEKRYVIAVDKTELVYRAYFYMADIKYDPAKAPAYIDGNKFIDAGVTGCFSCHASGPRKLRPATSENISDLDMGLINGFNQRILGYGPIVTIWPPGQDKLDAHLSEVVTNPACISCHDKDSIRAPIFRYHQKSISTLISIKDKDDGSVINLSQDHEGQLTAMPPNFSITKPVLTEIMIWINN